MMRNSEQDFKAWFRKAWPGWVESYEPRRGGGTGVADIQVAIRGQLLPLELKVGEIKNGILFPKKVRGVQIGWHKRLGEEDVASAFLVGCVSDCGSYWQPYWVDPWKIVSWADGLDLHTEAFVVRRQELIGDMVYYWENFLLRREKQKG